MAILDEREDRLVLAGPELAQVRRRRSSFARARAWLARTWESTVDVLVSAGREIRAKPHLAPVFVLLLALLLLAGALIAVMVVLVGVLAWMFLAFFPWAMVAGDAPRTARVIPEGARTPRSSLPGRIVIRGDGWLGVTHADGSDGFSGSPQVLEVKVGLDAPGLAPLLLVPPGAAPIGLVVDGVRGADAAGELALRIGARLGLTRFETSDDGGWRTYLLDREDDFEEVHPYRAARPEVRGAIPAFAGPMVLEAVFARSPPSGLDPAQLPGDEPVAFDPGGGTLSVRAPAGSRAGFWQRPFGAALDGLLQATAVAALVRGAWLVAPGVVRATDASSGAGWWMSGITLLLLAGRWCWVGWAGAVRGPSTITIDRAARQVVFARTGSSRTEAVRDATGIVLHDGADGADTRLELWLAVPGGDRLLWSAEPGGPIAPPAREAARALAATAASWLGVDWVVLPVLSAR